MATRSTTITVNAELAAAYKAAPKIRQKEALSAMRHALRVVPNGREKALQLSKEETELFLRINRNLSEGQQQRYDTLTEKRLSQKLTAAEQAELGELIEEVEQLWAERLQAVNDLARLRQVSPEKMMRLLELDPRAEAS